MKTITTKYLPATDFKPARIVATDGDGNRAVKSYGHEHNAEKNHETACLMLCKRMGWKGVLQGGDVLRAGKTIGTVFSWIDDDRQIEAT